MVYYIYLANNPKTAAFAACFDTVIEEEETPSRPYVGDCDLFGVPIAKPVNTPPAEPEPFESDYHDVIYKEVTRKIEPAVFVYGNHFIPFKKQTFIDQFYSKS